MLPYNLKFRRWLVSGARPGDSLFFSFSGHGGQVRDVDGDEADGLDETILPEDYKIAGKKWKKTKKKRKRDRERERVKRKKRKKKKQ